MGENLGKITRKIANCHGPIIYTSNVAVMQDCLPQNQEELVNNTPQPYRVDLFWHCVQGICLFNKLCSAEFEGH